VEEKKEMKVITIHVPKPYLKALRDLVEMGLYPTRAEAIRLAIRDLIVNEHPKYRRKRLVKSR